MMYSKKSLLKVLRFEGDWDSFLIEANRAYNNENGHYYTCWLKAKRDAPTQTRLVEAPSPQLKKLQKCLHLYLNSRVIFPVCVQGAVKRRSPITNASMHRGSSVFFQTDISKFFPSVNSRAVYTQLNKLFSDDLAFALTRLTTYCDHLPTGSPTSPILANLVFAPIDARIIELCDTYGLVYSRWIDDLTISGKQCFSANSIPQEVLSYVEDFGFKVNKSKTTYTHLSAEVTGCRVAGHRLTATKKHRLKLSILKSLPGRELAEAGLKGFLRAQGVSNGEHYKLLRAEHKTNKT